MTAPAAQPPAQTFRNVYTVAEFAQEILCGNRTEEWTADQCRKKRIKTVASRPYLIPQSEAVRFVSGK